MRSNWSIWFFLMISASCNFSSASFSLLCSCSSFFSRLSSFLSMLSSFCWSLRSCLVTSLLRSLISLSASRRNLCISSFASINTSFFLVSAVLTASFTIFLASSSALPVSASATFRLYATPNLNAIIPKIIPATTKEATQSNITVVVSIGTTIPPFRFFIIICF